MRVPKTQDLPSNLMSLYSPQVMVHVVVIKLTGDTLWQKEAT